MAQDIQVIRAAMFSAWETALTKCYNEKPVGVKSGDLGDHGALLQGQGILPEKSLYSALITTKNLRQREYT
jgi:hypothetical protein